MCNTLKFSSFLKQYTFLCTLISMFALPLYSAVVEGNVYDQDGKPVTNIRVKVRKGTKSGTTGQFSVNWYYEEKYRIKNNEGHFIFENVSVSSDVNDVCMLFTLSGSSTDFTTTKTENFILNGDTSIVLVVKKIIWGSMAVQFVDSTTSRPLSGAVVAAGILVNAGGMFVDVTDNTGWVLLDSLITGSGDSYRMTANLLGYAPVSVGLTMAEAAHDTMILYTNPIDTPATGMVYGTMTDTTGKAIKGGLVVLKFGSKEDREFYVGITDQNGNYTIVNVQETYLGIEGKIEAGADGYQDIETVWVVDNNDIKKDFVIAPSGGDGNGTPISNSALSKFHFLSYKITLSKNTIHITALQSDTRYRVSLYSVKGRTLYKGSIIGSSAILAIPGTISNQKLFLKISRNNGGVAIFGITNSK